jgi:hypothetical protein
VIAGIHEFMEQKKLGDVSEMTRSVVVK